MITSNLLEDVPNAKYIFSRNELVYHDDVFCDDSTLMLLNILRQCNVENVYIAGFDGYQRNTKNFYDVTFNRKVRDDDYESNTRKKS